MKKIKILFPIWNRKFELLDGSYSISDIQDYFEHILKKHETVTDNLQKMNIYIYIYIYIYQIEYWAIFRIKSFNFWNNEITWNYY